MPEIISNAVPCCVTDISTGRILWEWHQDHWIIAVTPAPALMPPSLPDTTASLCGTCQI